MVEHGVFAGALGVAFKERGGEAVVEAEDEGVVVGGGAGVGVGGLGGEDGDGEALPEEEVVGGEVADGDVEGGGLGEERLEGGGVGGLGGEPELAGAEVAEDGEHAAHVVGSARG